MDGTARFTREQVILLSFISIIGNIAYIYTWMDEDTGRASWLASFAGILLIIPFSVWIFHVGESYPEGTIFDILETGLGKFVNIFISLIYIFINIAVAVAHLNMFTEMLKVFFLQYTPPWVIMACMILMGVLFLSGKIQSFARLVEILAVLGTINYFMSFMLIFPSNFHLEYIIPVFDTSLYGFIKGVVFMAGGASECLLLLMVIIRFIPDPARHFTWIVKGIVSSAIIFAAAVLIITAMMSPELAKRIAFGGVNAARLIHIGEFIQGLELFVFATYQFIAICKITMYMYCAWTASKKIFNNKKPLLHLFITSIMIFLPSVWLNSYNKAYYLAVFLAEYIILPFLILILLLASISIMIKNNRRGSVPE